MLKWIKVYFCQHEYELIDKTVTKSEFEVAVEAAKNFGEGRIPHQMCHAGHKYIFLLRCKHCGSFKKIVETNS